MPFSKFIVFPIFVALQAAVMMFFAPHIYSGSDVLGKGFLAWVAFQSWAMYFLGGCTLKMAGKTIIGYFCGILAAIAIFELTGVFSGLPASMVLPAAVFVVVVPLMCAEKVEILNFIPAWFMGAAVFFALNGPYMKAPMTYVEIAIPVMIACVVGLAFGWCTVTFRTWYESKVMPETDGKSKESA